MNTRTAKGATPIPQSKSLTVSVLPTSNEAEGEEADDELLMPCLSVTLPGEDIARLNGFLLVDLGEAKPALGRVLEILRGQDGRVHLLLQQWDVQACILPYRMPAIRFKNVYMSIKAEVSC